MNEASRIINDNQKYILAKGMLMRIITILLIFVCIPINKGICSEFDFRKVKWGMSIDQVMASESLEVIVKKPEFLGYQTLIAGKKTLLIYFFIQNKLFKARYAIREKHSNKNDYIADYKELHKILTKKYGKPLKDDTYWRNKLFKNNFSDWGMAVSVGHLVFLSEWGTDETRIQSLLKGDNHKINLVIEYNSKALENLVKEAQQKKKMKDF
jgi:hypothetical protein